MKKDRLLFKLFLALLCLMGTFLPLSAQNITIQGDGTLNKLRMPLGTGVNLNYNYCATECLITAQELGREMDITSLALRVDSLGTGGTRTRRIVVYMGEVNASSLSSISVGASYLQRMWSGTKTFSNTGSYTFSFSTPYHYSGDKTLLVAIYDSTGAASAPIYFACEATGHSHGVANCTSVISSNSAFALSDYSTTTTPRIYNNTVRPRMVLGTANRQPVRHVYAANEWDCQGASNITFGTSSYPYSYSQSVIKASELGNTSHKITKVSVKCRNNILNSHSFLTYVTIYLADITTARPTSHNSMAWIPRSKLTKVFSGSLSLRGGWNDIELDVPFFHEGNKNLAVVFDDNSNSVFGASYYLYQYNNPDSTYATMYAISAGNVAANSLPTPDVRSKSMPLMRFTFDADGTENVVFPYFNDESDEMVYSNYSYTFGHNHSYTQIIYKKEKLNGPMNITSLGMKVINESGTANANFQIYIGETDCEGLYSEPDHPVTSVGGFMPKSNLQLVYSGSYTIDMDWNNIPLTDTFSYSGQGNLLIAIKNDFTATNLSTLNYGYSELNPGAYKSSTSAIDPSSPGTASLANKSLMPMLRIGYSNGTVVPNGNVSASKSTTVPAAPYWKQSKVQQIFLQSKMGGARMITGVSFRRDSLNLWSRNWRIALGTTTKSSYSSGSVSEYVPYGDLTLVYDGTVQCLMSSPTESEWFTITFDRPYYYNGSGNLVMDIIDKTNSENCVYFGSVATSSYRTLYTRTDSYNVYVDGSTSGSITPSRDNVQSLVRFITTDDVVDPSGNYVQVGTANNNNITSYYPTSCFYRYGLTQQVYAASEMGSSKTITSISFHIDSIPTFSRNLTVYLANRSWSYFGTAGTDDVGAIQPGGTKVFQGMVTHMGKGWVTIKLDTPFEYIGGKNLVVTIDDNTGSYTRSNYFSSTNCSYQLGAQYYRSDDTNPTISATGFGSVNGNRTSYRAVARFGFVPGPGIDTTSPANNYREVPVNPYYNYSYSQQIFTASEMGGQPMIISGLKFKYLGSSTLNRKVQIFLASSSKSSFSSTSDWLSHNNFTNVYTGNIYCDGTGWINVQFPDGYYYNGTSNLIVAFRDTTGTYTNGQYFLCDTAASNCAMTYKNDGSTFSLSSPQSGTVASVRTLFRFLSERKFQVNTKVTPAGSGTATGGGEFPVATPLTLVATPAPGYQFDFWSNNVSSVFPEDSLINVVTPHSNITWTAHFAQTQYVITTSVSPANSGTVSGGGTYTYGQTATLTATANSGYHFDHWSDGNTNATRTITVTGAASYTAVFVANTYTIYCQVSPANSGTVTGTGNYTYGQTCTLTATANTGYHFDHWSNNTTANPRTITVNQNLNVTAYFSPNSYTITANASPAAGGTVTGGGTYTYGQTATLTATAATGYHFTQWNDGNTNATRTVSVTGNATYTATFAPNTYTITTTASPSAGGSVTGGGTYSYGQTATLTAVPATGYHFTQWNDGVTTASRTITVTANATYTATFEANPPSTYTITVVADPASAGTVSGGGTYTAGSSVTLTATANTGYTFSQWNDGNTNATRTITVTANATYTASFTANTYTITTAANPTAGGTVTGGGTYSYGQTATLTATANTGYTFTQWSDGNTNATRTVNVTANATYTANFTINSYTISTSASPSAGGSISGGGTFTHGQTCTLTATANTGYHFDHWSNNSTTNPRVINVTRSMNVVGYFVLNSYTVTTNASPADGGTVTGGGTYTHGQTATLTATPATGYTFSQWSDGNTNATRTVTVTSNVTYTAQFTAINYTLTVNASPTDGGTVTGGGSYTYGQTATLTATPATGYTFTSWNDGNTNASRTVTVTGNATYTATFTINSYTITTSASPAAGGSVTGGGTYTYGQTATLTAVPATGYHFTSWNDGVTTASRTITVTANATYTATFEANPPSTYTITVLADPAAGGTVTGGGTYSNGATATLTATANTGYTFTSWNDGNTNASRTITVTGNATYTASFTANTYTVTTVASPADGGTVTGGGTYSHGQAATLTATPATGYTFTSWNDGNTNATRTITVTSNATYTATFTINSYTVSLTASPATGGVVTGAGTYTHGQVATITATANTGYTFTQWSDGNTNATRTITVTDDISLTATFSANSYTLTTAASPVAGGTVTGGGTYTYGQTATLTATANAGYNFASWNDGITLDTRTVTVTGNATYTATFTAINYTITVAASPAAGGTVTGGGTYTYGQTATLTATANTGYTFTQWSDGNTNATRTITVTDDASYTATFTPNTYTVTTVASPVAGGTVSGAGSYTYGQTATLSAAPATGYHFTQWQDGNTNASRTITVTCDTTFTASFGANASGCYTVTVIANPADGGTVTGSGTYVSGAIAPLTATPATGYTFTSWNDGNTNATRTITVTADVTYTATFTPNSYTITTAASPAAGGTVTGGGTYTYGATINLEATSNVGYSFSAWQDGNTDNPRSVTVTSDATYTATFTANTYTVTTNVNPSNSGTVTGGGTYSYGQTATLNAIANAGYHFSQWNDGSTINPRQIVVVDDATFTALFEENPANMYTINVVADPIEGGMVTGSGSYDAGTVVTLTATANSGYHFTSWNDGNTSTTRSITVTEDATYTAHFEADDVEHYYTITVLASPEEGGTVIGGGTYLEGTQISIGAFANEGYYLYGWDDGNTDNPRNITVTEDATFTAVFSLLGIDQVDGKNYIVTTRGRNEMVIAGAVGCDIVVYDAVGRKLFQRNDNRDEECVFNAPAAGMYIIWFSDAPARRVTVARGN